MYGTNIHVQKLSGTLRDVHGNIGTWNNNRRISNNKSTSADIHVLGRYVLALCAYLFIAHQSLKRAEAAASGDLVGAERQQRATTTAGGRVFLDHLLDVGHDLCRCTGLL